MSPVPMLILGLVLGLALAMGAGVTMMRTRMLTAHPSRRSFQATCEAVERVVGDAEGWGMPIDSQDLMATLVKHGQVPPNLKNFRVFFVCNPKLASRMLSLAPEMAGMMPCSWAVYEDARDRVFLSKMNVGLMSRMFGGEIGAIMGKVGRADEAFLAEVLG